MINIKRKNNIWTIKVEETFAFETTKELEETLQKLMTIKEKNGNLFQLEKNNEVKQLIEINQKEIDYYTEKLE